MSETMTEVVKRWTAKHKSALAVEVIQGNTTAAEASRTFDLAPSEIGSWVDDAEKGMENALKTNPLDVRQENEKQLKDLQEVYGEAMSELRARKKLQAPPQLDDRFIAPIKPMIIDYPSFGYRTVAYLLEFNKNTVQRVCRIKGWQLRERPTGARPRIEALPSVAEEPNERRSTDLARVGAARTAGARWPC